MKIGQLLRPCLQIKGEDLICQLTFEEDQRDRTNIDTKLADISAVYGNIVILPVNPVIKSHLNRAITNRQINIINPIEGITGNLAVSLTNDIRGHAAIGYASIRLFTQIGDSPDAA